MSCSLLSATHPHPTFRFFWFENTQESVYVAKFKLALLLFHENNRGANLLWCMWGFLLLFLRSIHCPHRYVHKKSLAIAKSSSSETGYGIDQNRSTSRFLCVCMCVCVRVDHHVREDCSTIGPRTHQWWQPYPSLQCMYPSYLGSILMYCWLPPVNPLALVPFFPMPKRFGKRNNKTRDPRQWRKWSISQPFINFMCKLEMMICTCAKEKILLLKRWLWGSCFYAHNCLRFLMHMSVAWWLTYSTWLMFAFLPFLSIWLWWWLIYLGVILYACYNYPHVGSSSPVKWCFLHVDDHMATWTNDL